MAIKALASITLSTVRDVESVWRYYRLVSQTASKPAKPTTNPPDSAWVKTEPAYQASMALYFTDLTVFTDGSYNYSDVSLSSSYTAANQAYNKAESASSVANSNVSGVPITYYRLTDGSSPTHPGTDSTGWSTSITSATAQVTGGFTSGCKYWACTYTLYGDGTYKWGDVTYAEVETTAATNEYNVKMAGQYFWHDSSGAHVGYRDSDGNCTGRTDIDSTGLSVYQSSTMVAKFGTNDGTANSQVGSSQSTNVLIGGALIQFYEAMTSLGYISNEKAYFEAVQARGRLIMPGGLKAKDTPDGNIGFYL